MAYKQNDRSDHKQGYDAGKQDEIVALWQNPEEREQFSEWDYVCVMNTFYVSQARCKKDLQIVHILFIFYIPITCYNTYGA